MQFKMKNVLKLRSFSEKARKCEKISHLVQADLVLKFTLQFQNRVEGFFKLFGLLKVYYFLTGITSTLNLFTFQPTTATSFEAKRSATSIELVKADSRASLNPKVKCVVVTDSESATIRRPSAISSKRRVSVISRQRDFTNHVVFDLF